MCEGRFLGRSSAYTQKSQVRDTDPSTVVIKAMGIYFISVPVSMIFGQVFTFTLAAASLDRKIFIRV